MRAARWPATVLCKQKRFQLTQSNYALHCVSDYLPMTLKLRFCIHSCSWTMAWWWSITEVETSCQVITTRKDVCGWKHCYTFKTTQYIPLNVTVTATGSCRYTIQEIARIPDENHEEIKRSPTHGRGAIFCIIDHNTALRRLLYCGVEKNYKRAPKWKGRVRIYPKSQTKFQPR